MKHRDKIEISGLRIRSRVGVTDEERESAQELVVDVIIRPLDSLRALSDDIARTIDYDKVATQIRCAAEQGSRRLIETLAEEIAEVVLEFAGVDAVEVEVKKYILPDTDYVSVRICLDQTGSMKS